MLTENEYVSKVYGIKKTDFKAHEAFLMGPTFQFVFIMIS